MTIDQIPSSITDRYEVREWKHATAVLMGDYPDEWADIVAVLNGFELRRSQMLAAGGGRSPISKALDSAFYERGWEERSFDTKIVVDGVEMHSPTHKVDCYRNQIALEIEWSNKDPFYDRDLNNFRLLHELRAISVGVIITKSVTLRPIMEKLGIWAKYGTSTTWMNKLRPRADGGGGGGCPLLVFGIGEDTYVED